MLRKPLTAIDDDTEEAPWMVMGMSQYSAVNVFYDALIAEMSQRDQPLLVAAMLPIRFWPVPGGPERVLSPDIMVARVDTTVRPSYDVSQEGVPPEFVLEVISPESQSRDLTLKPEWYAMMGVLEYALFAPDQPGIRRLMRPQLHGYRLDPSTGEHVLWTTDANGRLFSEVLQLWIAVRDGQLRAQHLDGTWMPTHVEAVRHQQAAERAREIAEARVREVEAENAWLRDELSRRNGK